MEQARHGLGWGRGRYALRRRRDGRGLCDRVQRRWLHHEPAAGGSHGRQGLGGICLRWRAAGPGAWRPGQVVGATPLSLEEREVGAWAGDHAPRPTRLLGVAWLPRLRGPMAGTAIPGRLGWQLARVVAKYV